MKQVRLTPKRKRFTTGLAIALVIGMALCLSLYFNLFSSMQARTSDLLFHPQNISQGNSDDSKIVIVGIDDKSLNDLGQFQSWTRTDYALVVDNLAKAGARVIVFDVVFSEPADGDADLVQAMAQAGNVIMPEAQTEGSTNYGASNQSFLEPLPGFVSEAAALGATNVTQDPDNVVRSLPAIINDSGTPVPALSLAAVAEYLRRPIVLESEIVNNNLSFDGRNIPIIDSNQILINYQHAAGDQTSFLQVSFSDVLNNLIDPYVFKDKIVLIGATAIGLGDVFSTPLGNMYGVEIHANAITMILNASFLKPVSPTATMATMIALALICAYVTMRWKLFKALSASIFLLFGCFLAAIVLFDRGTIFNAFFPSLTILGTVLGVNIFNVGTERSQRDEMRKTFGRYVSPTVAAKILNSMEEGQLLLDGQEQVVTTMFADVRGYTHLSRIIEPSKLITLLNVYLSAIIDPVIKHEGIVNKFAGDNIMAVWNAPETCYEHPLMAVKAALDAQRAIAAVWERQPGMPRMEFGIGIDTGVAVVGNMGSEDRLEYSVIGETVNFASRITSVAPANKIWIGASTYEKVKGYVEASEVENVVVKGGSLPFVVYEITALKSNGCLHENGGGS